MKNRALIGVAALVAVALALTGCSASKGGSTGAKADVAAATAALKSISDAPSPFPVTEPLLKKPTGKRIAILDCGTPSCELFSQLAQPAAAALGMTTTVIQAGQSADSITAAFDTVLSGGYNGVFLAGISFPLWQAKAEQLKAAGIAIVTTGVSNVDDSVGAALGTQVQANRNGAQMADWAIVKAHGPVDSVIYVTPELPFTLINGRAYVKRMAELCPKCKARVVDVPVASFGNNAASLIVDDLTAHPETTSASFAIGEQALGLPQALKTADIKISTLVSGPDPSQLKDVQDGAITAAFATDWPVMVWTLFDSLARLVTGEPVSKAIKQDNLVQQLLSGKNLKGDVTNGWSGYPDYADRFKALWSKAS